MPNVNSVIIFPNFWRNGTVILSHWRNTITGSGALLVAALLLSACASRTTVDAKASLSPEETLNRFAERTLADPGLRAFLQQNLGRVPTDEWDFEALCWTAFYYHPSLALARAQWASARALAQTSGELQNPTLSLIPGYDTTRHEGLSPWIPAVNFDLLVPTNGKRKLQRRIADNDAEAARLAVFTAAWQVRSDVRKAYFDAIQAQRRLGLLEQQSALQTQLSALIDQRFSLGTITAMEAAAARSSLLRTEMAFTDAKSQLAQSRARLAASLGVPIAITASIHLSDTAQTRAFADQEFQRLRQAALKTRPDLLTALVKFRTAQANLDLEIAKRIPDIHLGPGYQWDQGDNKWTLGVSFELPIFHSNAGHIQEAIARRTEAAAQFTLTQTQLINAIDLAKQAQDAATNQLARSRDLENESLRQRGLIQQRFAEGAADAVESTMIKLDVITAQLAVLDAENALWISAGQLEDALQVPLPQFTSVLPTPPTHA